MKFNYDKIMQPETVVHCDTKDKAIELLKWADSVGLRWWTGNTYLERVIYAAYSHNTCYYLYDGTFNSICGCNHNILKWEDVIMCDFRVGDKVSLVHWAEDNPVVKGRVCDIKDGDLHIEIIDANTRENGSVDTFNLSGYAWGDDYRTVYHGWNVKLNITGEEVPSRKKWVQCTKDNTKVGDEVRSKHGLTSWKAKIVLIFKSSNKFVLEMEGSDCSYPMSEFEIEVDA